MKYDRKHEHELEILWENMYARLKNNTIANYDDLAVFLGHSIISKIRQRQVTRLIQDKLFDEIQSESVISKVFAQISEVLLEAAIDDRPKQIITIKQQNKIDSKIS